MLIAPFFAGLLIPIALAVVLLVRMKQSFARDREQLATFASRLGLRGSPDPLSLAGAYDGLPLYVTNESVSTQRGSRAYTRVRLIRGGGGAGYREPHGATVSTFVVRRDEGFSFELAAGLLEVPSGSPTFDAVYRCFVPPGAPSPWSDHAMHVALMSMSGDLVRVERGPAECAATFIGQVTNPAVLERAVVVLASLASPQGAQRHHAQLGAPLDASPDRQSERLRWAVMRLLVVLIVGMMLSFPISFLDPVYDLVAAIACDDGDTVRMVGNGRGGSARCIGKHGIGETVNGALFLVSLDFAWVGVLGVFSVAELAVRLRRRRRT